MSATPTYVPASERYKVTVPEIDHDRVKVERFTISEDEARMHQLGSLFNGHGNRGVAAGTFTRLVVDGRLWMSDTRAEILDHLGAIREMERRGGRVLINGLGLGMVVQAALNAPNVEHVDVVERDPDVAALIGAHYAGERCTIHVADAYTIQWSKGTRWTVAWHDIWPDLCTDDLEGHAKLNRRYGRRVDWQGCWGHDLLLHQRRQDRRSPWGW